MVQQYNQKFYMVANYHFQRLSGEDFKLARALADWKVATYKHWDQVRIEEVTTDSGNRGALQIGEKLKVSAIVTLSQLTPDDVLVESYVGELDDQRKIQKGTSVRMEVEETLGDGRYLYSGTYHCKTTGNHGLGVRVIPHHEDLASKYEMALIEWA
jgi:starch phosphorylase